MTTVADLKQQSGSGPHPILHCRKCGAEYSANKGDYWNLPATHIFVCCKVPCKLVVKSTRYVEVA
jgi:hypothetical protein